MPYSAQARLSICPRNSPALSACKVPTRRSPVTHFAIDSTINRLHLPLLGESKLAPLGDVSAWAFIYDRGVIKEVPTMNYRILMIATAVFLLVCGMVFTGWMPN